MGDVLREKALELFEYCDKMGKGYITRQELLNGLKDIIPLDQESLSQVFDRLDNDRNGYLTIEEFTDGFGSFLGVENSVSDDRTRDLHYGDDEAECDNSRFSELLQNCGAFDIVDDPALLHTLYSHLQIDQPEIVGDFEEFVVKVISSARNAHHEQRNLEKALQDKLACHEEDVRHLYEEMETQIKQERQRILDQEQAKEKQTKDDLTKELESKDCQLEEFMESRARTQERLDILTKSHKEYEIENEKLATENELMGERLNKASGDLSETKLYADKLRSQSLAEKRERAQAALKITEGIAREREGLVQQLDALRNENKVLKDERDEMVSLHSSLGSLEGLDEFSNEVDSPSKSDSAASVRPRTSRYKNRHGSIIANYLGGNLGMMTEECEDTDDDVECDEISFAKTEFNVMDELKRSNAKHTDPYLLTSDSEYDSSTFDYSMTASMSTRREEAAKQNTFLKSPQRIFKIVFVGESGVGKTSFIHRFCKDVFKTTLSATIGVDFQTKILTIDRHIVALQLWDTAGQERFHCITSQYFRRADGIIVMYDVTNVASFLAIRNWINQIKDDEGDRPVVLVIANKIDKPVHAVLSRDSLKVVKSLQTMYSEVSCKTGENVYSSIEELARNLREREDREIFLALTLSNQKKKSKCCT